MRKFILLLFVALLFLTGCADEIGEDDVVITDRFFILQIEEIHLNTDEYLGRTIRYEGMFRSVYWPGTSQYYHYVIRYTDSCCGVGGAIGFEVYFENGNIPTVEEDAWVAVVGVLEQYEENWITLLRLRVTSITELDERGEEFVYA
ncbi:MAG: hypothetical protein FWD99_05980 [Oscillospiraceae bacterium]|nr:hypothetical protein [Oscillospiraceae bacterium]